MLQIWVSMFSRKNNNKSDNSNSKDKNSSNSNISKHNHEGKYSFRRRGAFPALSAWQEKDVAYLMEMQKKKDAAIARKESNRGVVGRLMLRICVVHA